MSLYLFRSSDGTHLDTVAVRFEVDNDVVPIVHFELVHPLRVDLVIVDCPIAVALADTDDCNVTDWHLLANLDIAEAVDCMGLVLVDTEILL